MNTIKPAETARRLRRIADLLDATSPVPLTVHLILDVSRYRTAMPEAQRIAAVDAIAAQLGLTAAPAKTATTVWEHQAALNDGGFHLSVATDIEALHRCACGAECPHATPSEETR